ncbi:hypothetical protein M9Y10_023707 [Tritrichomonas musculus]|uniref:Surface antigen BspA-like n=1 Tax=Tritrichomonas musculus TaxID=1915356 RepID=A0ABR2KZ28_9EUKA
MYHNKQSLEEVQEVLENKLLFRLNEEDKVAKIIGNYSTQSDVFIPRSIIHKGCEYIVTCIAEDSFKNSNNFSVQFAPDSELRTIEKNAFTNSTIERISLPSSVSELKDGWCAGALNLTKVSIMPNNQHYTNFDDKFIVEKNDKNDALIFARRDIKEPTIPPNISSIGSWAFAYSSVSCIVIPSNITQICDNAFAFCKNLRKIEIPRDSQLTIIGKYAFQYSKIESIFIPLRITKFCEGVFYHCNQLNHVDFPTDSELQIIEKDAFNQSSIENITIPSKVSELKDGWCKGADYLKKVTVSSDNEYFNNFDEKIIVGKSDINNDKFDGIVFANRNIQTVSIPPYIKKIHSYAFAYSSIETISIPSQVTHIGEGAFDWCYNLQRIAIPPESELKVIESKAFHYSLIESFYIPSHVTQISEDAFLSCNNLLIVEIDEFIEIGKINKNIFTFCINAIIMVPFRLKNDLF